MFTEINDKYYLNEQAMTVLMADAVSAYVKPQEQDGLEELTAPHIAAMDSERSWKRSRRTGAAPRWLQRRSPGHVQERPRSRPVGC